MGHWREKGLIHSCCPEVFYEKDGFKNFSNVTEKHVCWSLCFDKPENRKPGT